MRAMTAERKGFFWGLAGVLVGVLLAATALVILPAEGATGDTMIVGRPNQSGLATKLRSRGISTIKVINTRPAGVGLDIYTTPGQPPLQVNRAAWVQNLNADLLDDRQASKLLPIVESCSNDNIPDATDWFCEVSFTTPHAGTLVIVGSVDADYDGTGGDDRMWCRIYVDRNSDGDAVDAGDAIKYSDRDIEVRDTGPEYATCATNAAVATPAGNQVVRFWLLGVDQGTNDNTDIQQGSMWVMWVPD